MPENKADIAVLGGIMADIEGNPYGQLIPGDSNPGKLSISYGGVGRNIAENLARLSARAAFISAAGDDFVGRSAARLLEELGADTSHVRFLDGENTAMNLSVRNIAGDMELAISNTDVLERISPAFIEEAMDAMQNAGIVALDADLTEETLAWAADRLTDIPLFLDPVSEIKAERARALIGSFHTIKPDRAEAEVLCGMQILSEDALMAAGDWFSRQGVRRIFITMGPGGVYYKEGAEEGILRPGPVSVVNAAGAGAAFSAAVLDGHLKKLSVRETARYGMAAAAVAMESRAAVNPAMSPAAVADKLAAMVPHIPII